MSKHSAVRTFGGKIGNAIKDTGQTFYDVGTLNLGRAGSDFGKAGSEYLGAFGLKPGQKKPDMSDPGAPPNPSSITQGALQSQVNQEATRRWAQTAFASSPSSSSLLDDSDTSKPNTASRILLSGS